MTINSQKSAIFFLAFGVFVFILLAVSTFGHISGMELNENGEMDGCIFTGKTTLCKMSIIDHIARWQNMFTAPPQKSLMLITLFIFLLAVVSVAKNILAPPSLSSNKTSAQKLYVAQHPDFPLFDPLKEAISAGILNQKIYEFAVL